MAGALTRLGIGVAALLLIGLVSCSKTPEPKEAVVSNREPVGTFEIAKDPAGHWQRAMDSLPGSPDASSLELVSAAKFLSDKAKESTGAERKAALDANRARIEEAIARLDKIGTTTTKATTPLLRMQLAQDALAAGDMKAAEEAAESVLAGNTDRNDWNYGNAVYEMNMVMAGVALERGIPAEARRRVLLAAETPGSPQLDSFGPRFPVVYRLFKEGDRDLMVEFLEKVGEFWKSDERKKWVGTIQAGGEPDDARWQRATM